MLIRDLRSSDFDDMVETFYSFWPEVEADPGFGLTLSRLKPSMEDEHKWFADTLKAIEEGNAVMTVAEVGSHMVGWCDVRRVAPGGPLDHRGALGICIKKEFRGQGLGTALLNETLTKCKGKFELVTLGVLASNPRAHALYERFGFKDYGLMPGSVKRAGTYIDTHLMYLKL